MCCTSKDTPLPDHENSQELADNFSNFFSEKIQKINATFTDSTYAPPDVPPPESILSRFTLLSEDMVRKVIMDSPAKSCSLDPIPTVLLKACIDEILPITTTIFNMSLQTGIVPAAFKEAIITPLQKSSTGGTVYKNYRPVSNLPFLSKVLERLVLQQINQYCTQSNLQDKFQSAYRKGHSTETALLKIFDNLLTTMDNQMVSILTLLDLSAAFDTVHHNRLLTKLHDNFGIHDTPHSWFTSYLKDRFQRVKIGKDTSAPQRLSTGVPQGSGMGPWAYTSYTSDIQPVLLLYTILYHLFADDTQLQKPMKVTTGTDQLEARQVVERCVMDLASWMNINKLKLNSDKTEIIIIGTRQQTSKVIFDSVNICGNDIPTKDKVTNLGVIIDSDLKMTSQVNRTVRVCYASLHKLRKFKHHLTTSTLHILVQAFVISRLDYANSLYFGIPEYLMKRLQKVQNMAARLLCDIEYGESVTPALIRLHWLPINKRCIFKLAVITFNCIHDTGPSYLKELIVKPTPTRTLRSNKEMNLHVPKAKLKYGGERSFRVAAPKIWNSLPSSVTSTDSIAVFKSKLKHYLFTQAYHQYL